MISINNLRQAMSGSGQQGIAPLIARSRYSVWLRQGAGSKLIKVLTGFRRSGKSSLLKLFTQGLISRDVPPENQIYLELVQRYGRQNVFFGSQANGYEVDFVVRQEDEFLFYQVCWELNDRNSKRELGNLQLITKYLPGRSVVLALRNTLKTEDKLPIQPVAEWLLT